MSARQWPVALALLAIAVLGSYLLYTEQLVREFRTEAEVHQRMYALVQQGLLSTEPGAELRALTELQDNLTQLGVPIVALTPEGVPHAMANLPFEADLSDPADRARVLEYVDELDDDTAPIVEVGLGSIHFGQPPIIGRLRWAATLQVAGAILLLFVGYVVVRGALRAERERMWSAMARELAHQMGTPLTSLKGWHEVLRLPADERAEMVSDTRIAREVGADLDRLERVSRRFELIGKPPALAPVRPESVLRELEQYLRPRLPREGGGRLVLRAFAAGERLHLRVEDDGPGADDGNWRMGRCAVVRHDAKMGKLAGGWRRARSVLNCMIAGVGDNVYTGSGLFSCFSGYLPGSPPSVAPNDWARVYGPAMCKRRLRFIHLRSSTRPGFPGRFSLRTDGAATDAVL